MIALERSLLTDEVRSDRGAMAALLHPQWQEIGASGRAVDAGRAPRLRSGRSARTITLDVVTVSNGSRPT